MGERGLEFESALIGWLAHSPKGRGEFAGFYVPGVLEHAGVDRYVEVLLKHGPGSAGARLKAIAKKAGVNPAAYFQAFVDEWDKQGSTHKKTVSMANRLLLGKD